MTFCTAVSAAATLASRVSTRAWAIQSSWFILLQTGSAWGRAASRSAVILGIEGSSVLVFPKESSSFQKSKILKKSLWRKLSSWNDAPRSRGSRRHMPRSTPARRSATPTGPPTLALTAASKPPSGRVVPPVGLAPGSPRIATPTSNIAAAFQSIRKVFSRDASVLPPFASGAGAGTRASSGAVSCEPNEGSAKNTFPGL
mmetsp:Transcript_28459/g.67944  ORF Transcript_28459/g.67944 Transcript_28459/m.67944 type:complete len:200 (+) Transcript_28459:443-1042(+)